MEVQEEKIMDRIQKLIDKAMRTEFEPEQQALLQKADALMVQYSIDQIKLSMRQATDGSVRGQAPTYKVCLVQQGAIDNDAGNEVYYAIHSMFNNLIPHFHCRAAYKMPEAEGGGRAPEGHKVIIGYPSDIEFLEMLFLQLKMHMLANLSPKLDISRPWVENLANFKNVGMKWKDIHYEIRTHPDYPWRNQPWERKIGVSFTARYRQFMENLGQERVMTSSPETWRTDFVAGYVVRIASRLKEMRQQTVNEGDNLPALFKDKAAEVAEQFYILFPEERPHPEDCKCDACERRRKPVQSSGRGGGYKFRYRNQGAMNAGARVANSADLAPSSGRVSGGTKGEIR